MKDLSLNAYVVYDHDMGSATLATFTGTWFGVAARGTIQNLRWDADFVYGTKEFAGTVGGVACAAGTICDQSGWMFDAGVGMALPGTPLDLEVRGWWATGADSGTGDSDAFPVVNSPDHDPGAQILTGGGAVDPGQNLAENAQNTWGFGLIARWTASPALKVQGNVFYVGTVEEGTATFGSPAGDAGSGTVGSALNGVSSVGTEVSVKIDYTLYKGLVATLVGGYVFLGDDTGRTPTGAVVRYDDIAKLAGQLAYAF